MRPIRVRLLGTAVLVVGFQLCLVAGALRKNWEFDLKTAIRERAEAKEFPVFAVRFSPNGRYIAAVVHYYASGRAQDRLVIIDAEHPAVGSREIEIPVGILDDQHGYGRVDMGWTVSGDSIVVLGKRIPVAGPAACGAEIPGAESDWTQEAPRPWEPDRWTARLLILDAVCKGGLRLDLPRDWQILDISPNRRLLAVWEGGDVRVVDPVAGSVIRAWPRAEVPGRVLFAGGGKAICQASFVERSGKIPMSCWDVASGRKIAEAPTINGGSPFAASANAARVVGSDYFYIWNPFMDNSGGGVLKRRVVWDFRTGEELASWRPEQQTYVNKELRPPREVKSWYNFAVSPDGRFIVEGGDGVLRLYGVEP
jgi:hypothetical protein